MLLSHSLILCSEDTEKAITSGFFRLVKGTPLVYDYTYHEMKIIVDGSFIISDDCGNKIAAKAGDDFYFPRNPKSPSRRKISVSASFADNERRAFLRWLLSYNMWLPETVDGRAALHRK